MDDINKCCLCRQNNANQTGSHILPFSLIKEAVNQEGKISRDFEIAYSMSKNEFDENYFGRNVTPEKIKEEVGKEMTDKDVSQNINPFIKDNFLCSFCEKRLEKLESLFASSVLKVSVCLFLANDTFGFYAFRVAKFPILLFAKMLYPQHLINPFVANQGV